MISHRLSNCQQRGDRLQSNPMIRNSNWSREES